MVLKLIFINKTFNKKETIYLKCVYKINMHNKIRNWGKQFDGKAIEIYLLT